MKIRFIGDVHGKFTPYKNIIKDVPVSMQVGDMGVGFFREDYISGQRIPETNPPFDVMERGDHTYIRGNHDNPAVCRRQKHWIPDGTMKNNVFCVGGAVSIDKEYRVEGLTWWPDEELSHQELLTVYDDYVKLKPRYVMTHETPSCISDMFGLRKYPIMSNTPKALEYMWEEHKPDVWVFGHWHLSFDRVIMGTRFICLNELEYIDLEIEQ